MTPRPQPERVAVRNAGDREQVKRARKAERAAAEQRRNLVVQQMSSYDGRWFVSDLIVAARVYKISMAADPYATAFNEGQRNFGLATLAELTSVCPEQYLLMEQERIQRETYEPNTPEPAEKGDDTEDEPTDA